MKNVVIILGALIICSCKPHCTDQGGHNVIKFQNNSARTITLILTENQDTVFRDDYTFYETTTGIQKIKPHSLFEGYPMRKKDGCYEQVYANGHVNWYYFFDRDSIDKYSWDTVNKTHAGLLERRKIDLQYLIDNDFTITYEE